MSRIIVHIDLNYFFVRCEEIKDPSLVGKPVAVGHDGRGGIVSTCSYKAREYGIHSGMPTFQAKKLCPNLIMRSSDFAFYGQLSRQFKELVKSYSPLIEDASIDECYADFTDILKNVKDPIAFFKDFQKKLFLKTKLFCSIGVATNKFLAKMGSDYKKPNGITILSKREFRNKIYPLKIEDMYGIGKKTSPRLRNVGVTTIGELADKVNNDDQDTKNILGKFFYTVKDWVNGEGDDEIHPYNIEDVKSIGTSTTLPHDTNNYEEIKDTLYQLAKDVSQRAKKDEKLGRTVQLVMKDTNFITQNKSITFDNPTNDVSVMLNYALKLLDKHYDGRELRLVGITLQNLIDPKDVVIQMTFYDYEAMEEEARTKLLINELNRRLSKPLLFRASEIRDKKK